jgi:ferredoxin-nitrite reductase
MAELNPVEIWKAAKHGFDVWPDLLRWAKEATPPDRIDEPDLQRMKWYGIFWRKHDRDRYMIRIRIPGCEMTADQARAVAFVAYEAGHEIVDVTTRGNMQVQGLTIQKVPGVIAALERVGLTSKQTGLDNIRNVTSHPLSGVDPDELIDTRALARAVTDLFIDSRELSDLPRKFNIALSGRAGSTPSDWTQDISWLAARGPDGAVGFRLLIGGTQGQNPHLGWHIPVFVHSEQVVDVTYRILQTFRELGSRSAKRTQVRFRYLVERIGPDGVLTEVERRLGFALSRFPEPPAAPGEHESFVGFFPQKQRDRWSVGVAVPMGRLTWQQMEGLAVLSRKYGDGTLRTATDQNILLPNVPGAARELLGRDLAALRLAFEADSLTRNTVVCTGKQFCSLAVTETKGYGFQLVEELRRRRVETFGIRIAMSGCPNACAQHHTADIGLKGAKVRKGLRIVDGFDLYLGGGVSDTLALGTLWKKGVPFGQLPELLERVILEYHVQRQADETFSAFWRRRLRNTTPEVVAPEEPPAWRCQECTYLHAGEEAPPFCPRCAALRARFVREDGSENGSTVASELAGRENEDGRGSVKTVPSVGGPEVEGRHGSPGAPRASGGLGAFEAPSQKLWRCGPCGYEHHGEDAPDICPVCGAAKEDFKLVSGASTPRARRAAPSGRRIVIVGGSIAGHTAADVARELDPDCRITLVTDERHRFYNRLNLTRYLSDEVVRDKLFDFSDQWYTDHQVDVLTEARAITLDPVSKRVVLANGVECAYDALILAHGSSASVPPFHRPDLPGVFLLRTLEDADGILAACRPGARAAVIGGGVLGLEAAYGLVTHGASVTVFELAPRLMPRQLDADAAALFAELVKDKGITSVTEARIQSLLGGDHVDGLALSDGRRFEADLVVVSTGIQPNVDWLQRAGLDCGRGVLVDDRMRTSADDVYAAGDVVEWRGQVVGLWTNAIEHAKVAAANAVGRPAQFSGFVPVTILKCLGIPCFSIGSILADGGEVTSQRVLDPASRIHRRVIVRNGLPVGGILLNTTDGMADMKKLVEGAAQIERLSRSVLVAEPATAGG